MSGLKKTKKNNEKYVAEYKNMKEKLCGQSEFHASSHSSFK